MTLHFPLLLMCVSLLAATPAAAQKRATFIKGTFTACEEAVPKWSFTADSARIKTNDRLRLKNAKFRVKNVPLAIVPFAST